MVDIFRNCGAAGSAVDEALALDPKPKVIWLQLIVINEEGPQGHACKALP
jgi:predicted CoA-binding protein